MLTLYPYLWALLALGLLGLTERWIHRHLQQFAYQLTNNQTVALATYAILLFPGVLLHELSHWLFAQLLGVRTGRVSLLPARRARGQLQLGSVEYSATGLDPIRESLVGVAPLITGCAALFLIANHIYGIPAATQAFSSRALGPILDLVAHGWHQPDFWLWFYLMFTIANAMMPSPADRRAWPAFLVILALSLGVLLILGWDDWLLPRVGGGLVALSGTLATTLTLTIGINLLMLGGLLAGEELLGAAQRA